MKRIIALIVSLLLMAAVNTFTSGGGADKYGRTATESPCQDPEQGSGGGGGSKEDRINLLQTLQTDDAYHQKASRLLQNQTNLQNYFTDATICLIENPTEQAAIKILQEIISVEIFKKHGHKKFSKLTWEDLYKEIDSILTKYNENKQAGLKEKNNPLRKHYITTYAILYDLNLNAALEYSWIDLDHLQTHCTKNKKNILYFNDDHKVGFEPDNSKDNFLQGVFLTPLNKTLENFANSKIINQKFSRKETHSKRLRFIEIVSNDAQTNYELVRSAYNPCRIVTFYPIIITSRPEKDAYLISQSSPEVAITINKKKFDQLLSKHYHPPFKKIKFRDIISCKYGESPLTHLKNPNSSINPKKIGELNDQIKIVKAWKSRDFLRQAANVKINALKETILSADVDINNLKIEAQDLQAIKLIFSLVEKAENTIQTSTLKDAFFRTSRIESIAEKELDFLKSLTTLNALSQFQDFQNIDTDLYQGNSELVQQKRDITELFLTCLESAEDKKLQELKSAIHNFYKTIASLQLDIVIQKIAAFKEKIIKTSKLRIDNKKLTNISQDLDMILEILTKHIESDPITERVLSLKHDINMMLKDECLVATISIESIKIAVEDIIQLTDDQAQKDTLLIPILYSLQKTNNHLNNKLQSLKKEPEYEEKEQEKKNIIEHLKESIDDIMKKIENDIINKIKNTGHVIMHLLFIKIKSDRLYQTSYNNFKTITDYDTTDFKEQLEQSIKMLEDITPEFNEFIESQHKLLIKTIQSKNNPSDEKEATKQAQNIISRKINIEDNAKRKSLLEYLRYHWKGSQEVLELVSVEELQTRLDEKMKSINALAFAASADAEEKSNLMSRLSTKVLQRAKEMLKLSEIYQDNINLINVQRPKKPEHDGGGGGAAKTSSVVEQAQDTCGVAIVPTPAATQPQQVAEPAQNVTTVKSFSLNPNAKSWDPGTK